MLAVANQFLQEQQMAPVVRGKLPQHSLLPPLFPQGSLGEQGEPTPSSHVSRIASAPSSDRHESRETTQHLHMDSQGTTSVYVKITESPI